MGRVGGTGAALLCTPHRDPITGMLAESTPTGSLQNGADPRTAPKKVCTLPDQNDPTPHCQAGRWGGPVARGRAASPARPFLCLRGSNGTERPAAAREPPHGPQRGVKPRCPRLPRIRGAPERGWVPLTSPLSSGTPPPPSGDPIPRHLPARRALLAAFRQSHDLMEQLFLSPPPAVSSRPGGERSPERGSRSHPRVADRPCGSLGRWGSPQWWQEGGLVPTGAEGCEGG